MHGQCLSVLRTISRRRQWCFGAFPYNLPNQSRYMPMLGPPRRGGWAAPSRPRRPSAARPNDLASHGRAYYSPSPHSPPLASKTPRGRCCGDAPCKPHTPTHMCAHAPLAPPHAHLLGMPHDPSRHNKLGAMRQHPSPRVRATLPRGAPAPAPLPALALGPTTRSTTNASVTAAVPLAGYPTT